MRQLLPALLSTLSCLFLFAQPVNRDSLKALLQKQPEDTTRVQLLARMANFYTDKQNDSAVWFSQAAVALSQKLNYAEGNRKLPVLLAELLNKTGNYAASLKVSLESVKMLEKSKDTLNLYWALRNVGKTYMEMEDYDAVLKYCHEIKRVVESGVFKGKDTIEIYSMIGYLNLISVAYQKIHQLDSALHYMQRYYQIAVRSKDPQALAIITNSLGNLHEELGHTDLSYSFHRMNLSYSRESRRSDFLSGSLLSLARLFAKQGKRDSAIVYAQQSLNALVGFGAPKRVIETTTFLSSLYQQNHQYDSAFVYLHKSVALKDSLFSQAKTKDVQNQGFNEMIRQQELKNLALKEKEERKNNLQYVAIAMGLITFVVLFLLLSSSVIANERAIKYLGIVGLLIVFEFINLLLHPYLASVTHHSPLLMLLIMVCIAGLLVPVHHRLEKWITHRFVEKNKRIRLAAARKVIASLEETGNQ